MQSVVNGARRPRPARWQLIWKLEPLPSFRFIDTSTHHTVYSCRSSQSLAPLPYSRPLDTPYQTIKPRAAMATASTAGTETGLPGDGGASKAAAAEELSFLSAGGALLAGEPQAPSVSDASVVCVRAPARLPVCSPHQWAACTASRIYVHPRYSAGRGCQCQCPASLFLLPSCRA